MALAPAPVIQVDTPKSLPPAAAITRLVAKFSGQPGAIICGEGEYPPGFQDAITALASRLACPILAEPLSNLRYGTHDHSHLLCRYDAWLRRTDFIAGHRPDWLLRFGAFPVTRNLQGFAAWARETVVLVDPLPRWQDPSHGVTQVLRADPLAVCEALLGESLAPAPSEWLQAFRQVETAAAAALPREAEAPVEALLMPAILSRLPAGCPVFLGNSMIIRDMDVFGSSGSRDIRFHGNRGASGIDGNVSTALGIAASQGRVVALLGDLTFQHDVGGLAAARGLNAVLMVLNNGGGGIFDYLPQAALPEFEQAWLTPQALDIGAAARAFGLGHCRTDCLSGLTAALEKALQSGGTHVIEVVIDRAASLAGHRAYWRNLQSMPM